MAAYFRQPKAGGGCCDCGTQETPCDGCENCLDDVIVTLQKRSRSNYGSKCGTLHPFLEDGGNPRRYFRDVQVDYFVEWEVADYALSGGGGGFVPGMVKSRCDIAVTFTDCETLGAAVWSSSWEANNWWDSATSGGTSESSGAQTDHEPWAVPTGHSDCGGADDIFARSEPGQPARYAGGAVISGLLTGNYLGGDTGAVLIPPATLSSATATGEVWVRSNDSLLAPEKGWGWSMSVIMEASGGVQVVAVRSGRGLSTVTLENEFTTQQLKDEVIADLVTSEWGDPESSCSLEELSLYENSYSYREIQFRFLYDYTVAVRIGYRIFIAGEAEESPVQYVLSPGDRVFTIFPSDAVRCVELVSFTSCL